jgi:hypothetical protein
VASVPSERFVALGAKAPIRIFLVDRREIAPFDWIKNNSARYSRDAGDGFFHDRFAAATPVDVVFRAHALINITIRLDSAPRASSNRSGKAPAAETSIRP